jgi:hypothetical protein
MKNIITKALATTLPMLLLLPPAAMADVFGGRAGAGTSSQFNLSSSSGSSSGYSSGGSASESWGNGNDPASPAGARMGEAIRNGIENLLNGRSKQGTTYQPPVYQPQPVRPQPSAADIARQRQREQAQRARLEEGSRQNKLGNDAFGRGDMVAAIACYRRACELSGTTVDKANLNFAIGQKACQDGDYKKGVPLLKSARSLYGKLGKGAQAAHAISLVDIWLRDAQPKLDRQLKWEEEDRRIAKERQEREAKEKPAVEKEKARLAAIEKEKRLAAAKLDSAIREAAASASSKGKTKSLAATRKAADMLAEDAGLKPGDFRPTAGSGEPTKAQQTAALRQIASGAGVSGHGDEALGRMLPQPGDNKHLLDWNPKDHQLVENQMHDREPILGVLREHDPRKVGGIDGQADAALGETIRQLRADPQLAQLRAIQEFSLVKDRMRLELAAAQRTAEMQVMALALKQVQKMDRGDHPSNNGTKKFVEDYVRRVNEGWRAASSGALRLGYDELKRDVEKLAAERPSGNATGGKVMASQPAIVPAVGAPLASSATVQSAAQPAVSGSVASAVPARGEELRDAPRSADAAQGAPASETVTASADAPAADNGEAPTPASLANITPADAGAAPQPQPQTVPAGALQSRGIGAGFNLPSQNSLPNFDGRNDTAPASGGSKQGAPGSAAADPAADSVPGSDVTPATGTAGVPFTPVIVSDPSVVDTDGAVLKPGAPKVTRTIKNVNPDKNTIADIVHRRNGEVPAAAAQPEKKQGRVMEFLASWMQYFGF